MAQRREGLHGGRKKGAKAWGAADTKLLLDVVEERLPCGADMWVNVAMIFNSRIPRTLVSASVCFNLPHV